MRPHLAGLGIVELLFGSKYNEKGSSPMQAEEVFALSKIIYFVLKLNFLEYSEIIPRS